MSEVIKIPLGEGCRTTANPSLTRIEWLCNFYTDNEDGSYIKRTGMGSDSILNYRDFLDNRNITHLTYWIDPRTEIFYWVGFDYYTRTLYRYNSVEGNTTKITDVVGLNVNSNETVLKFIDYNYTATQLSGAENILYVNANNWEGHKKQKYFFKTLAVPNFPSSAGWTEPTTMEQKVGDSTAVINLDLSSWTGSSGTSYHIVVASESPANGKSGDEGAFTRILPDGSPSLPEILEFSGSTITPTDGDGLTFTVTNIDVSSLDDSWGIALTKKHRIGVSLDDSDYPENNSVLISQSDQEISGSNGLKIKIVDEDLATGVVGDKWEVSVFPELNNIIPINWGNAVRTPFGHHIRPTVYQNIERGYFWMDGAFKTSFENFHLDSTPYPRQPEGFWAYEGITAQSGGELAENQKYYYKFTVLFDGDQESLLAEDFTDSITSSVNKTLLVKLQIDTALINPRTTAIKIYRAKPLSGIPENGEYKFIKSFNITENTSKVFELDTTNAYIGEKIMRIGSWNTNQLFKDTNTGIWDDSDIEILSLFEGYSTTTAISGQTFICPKDGTTPADFVFLNSGDPADKDSWGTIGNVYLYDDQGQQCEDPDCADKTKWDLISGSGIEDGADFCHLTDETQGWYYWFSSGFDGPTETGLAIGDTKTNGFVYWNIKEIPDPTVSNASNNVAFPKDTWVDVISTKDITMGSNANIFVVKYNRASYTARVDGSPQDMYDNNGMRIDIYRDSSVIATMSIKKNDNQTIENSPEYGIHIFDFSLEYPDTQFLSTDTYKITLLWKWFGSASTTDGRGQCFYGLGVRKMYNRLNNTYRSKDAVGVVNSGLGDEDEPLKDQSITIDDGSGDVVWVCDSHPIGDMFRLPTKLSDGSANPGWTGSDSSDGNTAQASDITYEEVGGGVIRLNYIDKGEQDGASHPLYGVTSLDTRYLYSEALGGRNFVANVNLVAKNGIEEYYDDMVMFSELGQPDVIPISNFIKLNDMQGGKINGLSSILSDLIVFAENGIFRISVPSTDPFGWSIVEEESNLGCKSPRSIKKWTNGVFFAGKDAFYYIDVNFNFINLTDEISEQYKSFNYGADLNLLTHIDNENHRLYLCNSDSSEYKDSDGNVGGNIEDAFLSLSLDIFKKGKIVWTQNKLGLGLGISPSTMEEGYSIAGMYEDHNLKTHVSVRQNSGSPGAPVIHSKKTYIKWIEATGLQDISGSDTTTNSNYGSGISAYLTTGWINLSRLSEKSSVFIKRVSLDVYSTDDIIVEVSIDSGLGMKRLNLGENMHGENNTVPHKVSKTLPANTDTGNTIKSIRIGRRAKRIQLMIMGKTSLFTTNESNKKIKIRKLEVEIG